MGGSSEPEAPTEAAPSPHAARRSPTPKEYVRIGLILGALTSIEVYLSYSGIPHGVMIAMLFGAAMLKFVLVVAYFMHLKYDDRRYARFFVLGLAGAFTLYLVVLLMFKVFSR
jgi:cytochrome c oxidase subunit 4